MIKRGIVFPKDSIFYKTNACVLIVVCGMSLLSVVGKKDSVDQGQRLTGSDIVAFNPDDHPALKFLGNPTPPIDKNDANKSVVVNKQIKLEENQLYSPINMFGAEDGGWQLNDGLYKLMPQGQDIGGKDNFTAEQVIAYGNPDKDKGYELSSGGLRGAAMGTDPAENKKPVMYLTQGNSPYTVWKAIDGERKLYKVAEFDNPPSPRVGQCFNSSTAMAPNGTLWFTNALDKDKGQDDKLQGQVVISMLDPLRIDAQGRNQLISSVDDAQRSTVINASDPEDTLEGQCLRAGVFDKEGFYYMRVGVGGKNTSDDILRFDLSEFPGKVTYTRIKFDIDKFGGGITWHDGKWWSAPIFDEVLGKDHNQFDPAKDRSEEVYAFNVDPKTAHKTLMDVPNFRDGYPLVPVNNMVSTEFVPSIRLDVGHSADRSEAARGDVAEYTVKINNADGGGGLWYTGEAFVDLAGMADSVEEVDAGSSIAEVVDAEGVFFGSGTIRRSGTRLIWSGTIPLEGSLTWRYQVKVKPDASNNKNLDAVVATSRGWSSNCPVGGDAAEAACQARVTVQDSDVYVRKVQESESIGSQGLISYSITAVNNGVKPYEGDVIDDLSGVLNKAQYNHDATSTIGAVPEFTSPILRWAGQIKPGETLTVKYSVRISPEVLKKR